MSSEGSKIVVKEILKVLKEADWQPSLHWRSLPDEFGEASYSDSVTADGTIVSTSQSINPWQNQWD